MAELFQFELEHIIPASFFGTGSEIDTLLKNSGFTSGNMRGNLIGLFSNADFVDSIQQAGSSLQTLLNSAGWGTVRHEGAASGGSQLGKNAFMKLR